MKYKIHKYVEKLLLIINNVVGKNIVYWIQLKYVQIHNVNYMHLHILYVMVMKLMDLHVY